MHQNMNPKEMFALICMQMLLQKCKRKKKRFIKI